MSKETKNVILMGNTRVGKDCFINTLASDKIANEGKNNKQSTTKTIEPIKISFQEFDLVIFNMPGFNDTSLDFTNEDLMLNLEKVFIEASNSEQIDAIIMVDTVMSDALQFNIYLKYLQTQFGGDIKKSIIAVGSKTDKAPLVEEYQEKLIKMNNQCQELKIPFIQWKSDNNQKRIDNQTRIQQKNNLFNSLERVQPYYLKNIKEIQLKIQKRADELFQLSGYQDVQHQITYQEKNFIPKQEKKQAYFQTYIPEEYKCLQDSLKVVEKDEQYTDIEIIKTTSHGCIGTKTRGGFLGSVLGIQKKVYGNIDKYELKEVVKTRKVNRVEKSEEEITKYRLVESQESYDYEVTVYDSKIDEKQLDLQVKVEKEKQPFIEQARQEWIEQQVKLIQLKSR